MNNDLKEMLKNGDLKLTDVRIKVFDVKTDRMGYINFQEIVEVFKEKETSTQEIVLRMSGSRLPHFMVEDDIIARDNIERMHR